MDVKRRGFFKHSALLSAIAAAPLASAVILTQKEEDTSHLAPPDNAAALSISGSYGPKENSVHGLYSEVGAPTNMVHMTVGRDNRLWMQVDGKWHRVALES